MRRYLPFGVMSLALASCLTAPPRPARVDVPREIEQDLPADVALDSPIDPAGDPATDMDAPGPDPDLDLSADLPADVPDVQDDEGGQDPGSVDTVSGDDAPHAEDDTSGDEFEDCGDIAEIEAEDTCGACDDVDSEACQACADVPDIVPECKVDGDCDDKNPCTNDWCGAGVCKYATNEDACNDGDSCTEGDKCFAGLCGGQQKKCDDSNPCTTDGCDPKDGQCVFGANSEPCDDGNICTVVDKCEEGKCVPGALATENPDCQCLGDGDCAKNEDGDLCNGTLMCKDWLCVVDPATVPDTCESKDDTDCSKNKCQPDTGKCAMTPVNEGGACEDGTLCTVTDTCKLGECSPGSQVACDDKNLCTGDACDSKTGGCVYSPLYGPCNDGDECTDGDACVDGKCVGSPVDCDDKNACTDDSCDPASGCVFVDSTAPCDDGNQCTMDDVCAAGKCAGGLAPSCDDKNACTDDWCDIAKGCLSGNNAKPCDDGNACTDGDLCKGGKCTAGAAKDCTDGNPCTDDSCDAKNGCVFTNNSASCDDGNACSYGDKCVGGACKGTGYSCDDKKDCTIDLCKGDGGCSNKLFDNYCLIDGQCVTEGTANPLNTCKGCVSLTSTTDWSNALDGKTCEDGGKCQAGQCKCKGTNCPSLPGHGFSCNAQNACEYTAPAGSPMIYVPAGPFWMGANKDGTQCPTNTLDSDAWSNELPCHKVDVPGFFVDKYEITVKDYKACNTAQSTKCTVPATSGGCNWTAGGKDKHPINCVNWYQVDEYCKWKCPGCRLCSESEWEKAARGTDGRLFPWGNQTPNCNLAVMWEAGTECDASSTREVGSKPAGASAQGAMDMAGNVWEYVKDAMHQDYGYAPTDGSAWGTPEGGAFAVGRGGSLNHQGSNLRSSKRVDYGKADYWSPEFGARCCASP